MGKTWGNNNDPAYGNIKALFQVRTDLNWTEQFTLGPVPFFLNVNPWVLAKLALAVGAHTHGSGAAFFKNISLDYSNTSGSSSPLAPALQASLRLPCAAPHPSRCSLGTRRQMDTSFRDCA